MKLEQQVCSLELSQKLKELGVKQESCFYWVKYPNGWAIAPERYVELRPTEYGETSAFTVAELGDMLPVELQIYTYPVQIGSPSYERHKMEWCCIHEEGNDEGRDIKMFCHTEADARAKMLIYLLESKLI